MFLLRCQHGTDHCNSIFTSPGNFNFMCCYEDGPMCLLTLYPQSTTLRYFKAFNEHKMFFKGCCTFPAGQQHCVHCWVVGGLLPVQ